MVKYNSPAWRSPLQHLLPNRFLPNPVPAKHNDQGIVMSETASPIFLPLLVNLQVNSVIQKDKMKDFIVPPYDLHCPSVEPLITKRCCSVCGIYHASIKSTMIHVKECHPKRAPTAIASIEVEERRRPVRIAARRQREMMVVLRDHLNGEAAEWLDVDDIDSDERAHDSSAQCAAVPLIENMSQWTEIPWEDA